VLRRTRNGRNLEGEAALMRHVRAHGYPVPEVFGADGPCMVMARVDGPTMLGDIGRRPHRLPSHARTLAGLHHRLRTVPPLGGLRVSPFPGDHLIHLDLHPHNVLLTERSPVVIDWTNAAVGDPDADVANTWLTVACADIDGSRLERTVGALGRRLFLAAFLRAVGSEPARRWLAAVADARAADRNVRPSEVEAMRRLVRARGIGSLAP
jgi:Ser/Thr protein kinase RdoA (MazF antagonist)